VTTIVWFRQDLRLADNLALRATAARGEPVVPIYIWAPDDEGDWPPGSASRWWLHQSLQALNESLRNRGSRLILASGRAEDVLTKLVSETKATAVLWNRRYEPAAWTCSAAVSKALTSRGVQVAEFNSTLLAEPQSVLNLSGKPYRVYTAYLRRLLRDLDPQPPLRAPSKIAAPRKWPRSLTVDALGLMPKVKWYTGIANAWQPGEVGAQARLRHFVKHNLARYREARDIPAADATSHLSPHLHFGEIGPRQIWHSLGPKGRASAFLREIIWREFAYHLLYHFPDSVTKPLRPEFVHFPWKKNTKHLDAWQRGYTGVPLVDAGMRELWTTGYMHNRVRMVVGSFLVKNLLQHWHDGARWFWDTLVDADLANNTLNWQWVAGSGADASPYFRIFNPVTQAKRYDRDGDYVQQWAADAPSRPIVELRSSREAALDAYADMRQRAKSSR
jgi:deoxyribodipyrimidine photo-lyase